MIERSQPSIVERINSRIHDAPMPTEHLLDEAAERIEELEAQLASARKALELAEDVLSRTPFSNALWPNGMHPQVGIEQIRDALKGPRPDHQDKVDRIRAISEEARAALKDTPK